MSKSPIPSPGNAGAFTTSPVNGRAAPYLSRLRERSTDATRLGAGHDEYWCIFNRLKYFSQTLFLLVNSFLYRSDGPERPHAPRFARHRGGAFAPATASTRGRGVRETAKTDEQFYCRSEAHRRAPRQSQRAAPWPAFGGVSREPTRAPRKAQSTSAHARPRPCAWQADARNRADAQCAACVAARPSPDCRCAPIDLSRTRERFISPLPFTGEVGNARAFPGEGIPGHDEGSGA